MTRPPTVAEMQAAWYGKPIPKGLPRPLAKKARQQTKAQRKQAFLAAVWARDQGRSRASGKPLSRSGTNYDTLGDVHHRLRRSTNPDRIYDVSNGILFSRAEHLLAETRCPNDGAHYLLEIHGPSDLGEPQTFEFRDVHGTVIRRRIG